MADCTVWLASQAGRLDELAQLPTELFDRVTLERALYVAVANDHAGTVCFLLRAGRMSLRHAPLNIAAWNNSADAMRELVKAKADINCNNGIWPAVVVAVEHRATACLRVLVLAKANLAATKYNGFTPVCVAAENGDIGMLRLLLQHKASADMREPITVAARHGHVGAVHALLLANAGIESTRCHGCTPLIAASYHGHVAVMLVLLQVKADAMHCSHIAGWSALSAAAIAGHAAAVRCLLEYAPALSTVATTGMFVCERGLVCTGSTPLDIARSFRHADVISLLVAATSSD